MSICSAVSKNAALIFVIAMLTAASLLPAQEETSADRQYREDYERYQKIAAISEPARRADQLIAFLKERPDSKLVEYAQGNYLQVLEGYCLRLCCTVSLRVLRASVVKVITPFGPARRRCCGPLPLRLQFRSLPTESHSSATSVAA